MLVRVEVTTDGKYEVRNFGSVEVMVIQSQTKKDRQPEGSSELPGAPEQVERTEQAVELQVRGARAVELEPELEQGEHTLGEQLGDVQDAAGEVRKTTLLAVHRGM